MVRTGLYALLLALLAVRPAWGGDDALSEWRFLDAEDEPEIVQVVAEIDEEEPAADAYIDPDESLDPAQVPDSAQVIIPPDEPEFIVPVPAPRPSLPPAPAYDAEIDADLSPQFDPQVGGAVIERPWKRRFGPFRPPLPVVSERWRERSLTAGLFVGGFHCDELIRNRVDMLGGAIGGVRLGWDFDDYWGLEGRAAFASADVESEVGPPLTRSGQFTMFDASILFYPWTTPRWRPFVLAGIGIGIFDFTNDVGLNIVDSTPIFPIGIGLKYRHDDWVAFRFDFTDTIALGDGLKRVTTNNLSVAGGVEFRFGGPRRTYWPWSRRWLR